MSKHFNILLLVFTLSFLYPTHSYTEEKDLGDEPEIKQIKG